MIIAIRELLSYWHRVTDVPTYGYGPWLRVRVDIETVVRLHSDSKSQTL